VIKAADKGISSPTRPGHGALEIQFVSGQSAVIGARSASPLKLLTPRPRGESVWAYTSSFGGGLVAGDQTQLEIQVGAGSRCFLGTQASTKIYRNPRLRPCGHVTHARLGTDALLVFAPDPVQPFAESSYAQQQDFRLSPGASLVLLDWFTAGRVARGEEWQFRRLQTRNSIYLEKTSDEKKTTRELVFVDSILLRSEEGPMSSQHRVGRYRCFAMLLFLGPKVAALSDSIRAEVAAQPVGRETQFLTGASPVRDGLVLRLAGMDVETVAREVRRCLAPLQALLGDDPWARKW
jgi:urease accessory protein